MKKIVSVVLPTFNEKANVERTVDKVLEQEKNIPGWEIHIVVADDIRSSDGTDKIVLNLSKKNSRIRLIKVNPGLGVGLIKGHRYALEKIHHGISVAFNKPHTQPGINLNQSYPAIFFGKI